MVIAAVMAVTLTPVAARADDPAPTGGTAVVTGTPDLEALRERRPAEIVMPAERTAPARGTFADCDEVLARPANGEEKVGCVRRVPGAVPASPPAAASPGITALAAADWNLGNGPVPRWCKIDQLETHLRMRECHVDTYLFYVYQRPSNQVVGEVLLNYWEWEELSNKQRTWTHNIQMYVADVSGLAVMSTYLNAQGWCSLGCTESIPEVKRLIRLERGMWLRGSWDMSSTGLADERTYTSADTDLNFLHLETGNTKAWTELDYKHRCERELPETPSDGGCVFDEVQPELVLSKAATSDHRRHAEFVEEAQLTTPDHYGARHIGLDPQPLQRMADKDRKAKNYQASCGNFVKDPAVPNDSCDEYPYQSTYQGANEIGRARTAVGHVPLGENSKGGTRLQNFYLANRVIDGDKFWVTVVDGPIADEPGRDTPPEVYAGEDLIGYEGAEIHLEGRADDAQGPPVVHWSYAANGPVDPGTSCTFSNPDGTSTTFTCNDDGTFTVTLTADDGVNMPVSDELSAEVRNVGPRIRRPLPDFAPRAAEAGLTPEPWSTHRTSSPVQLTAPYTDPGSNDTQTCVVRWDDGTEDRYPATGDSCDRAHTYAHAGMDTIAVTITDDDSDSGTDHTMIVVYDPDGGFITTGGWLNSPAGALTAEPALTDRLHVTLNPKYKPGDSGPVPGGGKVAARLQNGRFDLASTALEWLVVTPDGKAAVKGVGTVNGEAGYGFVAYGYDDPDRLRLVVWPLSAGDHPGAGTLYDNRPAGDYDLDIADPQPLDAGSVQVHG
ncbi:hypothetical protein GCM10010168_76080 [Actinoplanes ianthinogenes]|uniref:Deoxyribonuclease NucA/NucB domain-containing protein n=1 Tax=Actinoplanes ianthinogenes TaxID=122358 RepID=A0ABM7MA17_9ACTN|nr:hypothetical protein Aiant_91230 [Actinoplanes ianthinogenes]GGR46157.1 hypothetical protein GCM10010168_76080 [Actinoplanes ianthinogenes]